MMNKEARRIPGFFFLCGESVTTPHYPAPIMKIGELRHRCWPDFLLRFSAEMGIEVRFSISAAKMDNKTTAFVFHVAGTGAGMRFLICP
jgi:hypothetical protein